jgi:membrane-associated phospholipid phosphatase
MALVASDATPRAERARRISIVAAVVLLHISSYYGATRINAGRLATSLYDLAIPLDTIIPHLPWTWPLYWIAYPFVVVGGGAALLGLPAPAFRRAIAAFIGMTLAGALIQVLIPARAPWPDVPAAAQQFVHQSALVLPYANLPSMHVAYCVLAAAFIATRAHSTLVAGGAWLVAVLVSVATVTLKEHFILDAVAGGLLALAAFVWWRRGA